MRAGAWLAHGGATPLRRRLIAALPWIALVVVLAQNLPGLLRGNDFAVYHAAGQAVIAGTSIFESAGVEAGREYIYPPTLAALLAPLAALPFRAAAAVWGLASVVALVVALKSALTLVGATAKSERFAVGLLTLAAIARPLNSELGNGQVNLIVLCCVLAGATQLVRGRSGWAGVWWALAASLKVTPALLVGYLVLRRDWRALTGWIAGALLFLVVVPGIAMRDPGAGLRDTAEWARRVASPVLASDVASAPAARGAAEDPAVDPVRAERRAERARRQAFEASFVAGESLRAIAFRYLTPAPLSYRQREAPTFVNVVDLGHRRAQRVYAALAALVLLLTAAATLRRPTADGPRRGVLDVSMWLAAMLLISPVSRKAHFVALIPAFACGAAYLVRRPRSRAACWLGACVALAVLTSSSLFGDPASLIVRSGGGYAAIAIIPWCALLVHAWRRDQLPPAPSDGDIAEPGAP